MADEQPIAAEPPSSESERTITWVIGTFSIGALLLAGVFFYVFSTTDRAVRNAYYKQWTYNFLCDFHRAQSRWPTSWDEIEQSVDTKSPFSFPEIRKRVTVKWENLGAVIDLEKDYYVRTDPDTRWQGDDINRDLRALISDGGPKKRSDPSIAPSGTRETLRNWPSPERP